MASDNKEIGWWSRRSNRAYSNCHLFSINFYLIFVCLLF